MKVEVRDGLAYVTDGPRGDTVFAVESLQESERSGSGGEGNMVYWRSIMEAGGIDRLCRATTDDGDLCQREIAEGSDEFCWQHSGV